MNALEYLGMIAAGPVPANIYYGQWMLFANYLVLYYRTPESKCSLPLVVLVLCICNLILNLYQVYTQQMLTGNPLTAELEPELSDHITSRANKHYVTVVSKKLVTNFPTINAFCARLRHNAEIVISHHWFESEEGKKHLHFILEHEFGHAAHNHSLKRALFSSAGYIAITISMFTAYAWLFPTWTYRYHAVTALGFVATTIQAYAQAWYTRHTEFEADAFGAAASSPEEMRDALLFLESKNPYDLLTTNIPEWKQGTHPKMSNRIARLEAMKKAQ